MRQVKIMLSKKISLLFLVCFAINFSIAQQIKKNINENKYRALHWSVEDGLAYDKTYCMLKDVNGFLWVGTTEGLSRFDGSTFKNYYYDPKKKATISGPMILGLVEDSLHNIWIGTSKGLTRYDIKADTFANFSSTISNTTFSTFIVPFFATKDEIYCHETDSFITAYNIHSFTKKILIKLTIDDKIVRSDYAPQYSFFDAGSKSIWISEGCSELRASGLLQISLLNNKRRLYDWPCYLKIPHHCHWSEGICYDRKRNALWLNSSDGLMEFTLNDKQFHHIDAINEFEKSKGEPRGVGIDLDLQGRIWLSTYPKGIIIYNPADNSVRIPFSQDSSLQNIVSDENGGIYCDRDGIVWSGFWLRKGIYQFVPVSSPVQHYLADSSKNLWHNIITNCINAGNGKIWMGTDEDGIIIFDPHKNSFETLQPQNIWSIEQHPSITPIYIDTINQKAVLKVNGYNGLYAMDIHSKKNVPIIFKESANQKINITNIYASGSFQNKCMVSAEYGDYKSFFIVNIDSATARDILSFPKNSIDGDYATDGSQYLFLKRRESLGNLTYSFTNGKWHRITNPFDTINWSKILYNDADKSYWLVAPRELIHYDTYFRLLRRYTEEDGLPYSEIFVLLPDAKGNIWFNTNRCIYTLNIQSGAITSLSEKDGFVHQDFRSGGDGIKYNNGDLYFPGHGSAQGFVVVTPDKYKSKPALVYLKSLDIKQFTLLSAASLNNIRELSLKYFQNRIAIETGTIDYYSNGKSQIRYKLAGSNENWQYAHSNYTIRYEELPPGKYKLLMQAGNAGNEFNGPVKTLIVQISPAFWNTWWFRITASIFVIGLIYGFIRYRLHQKFSLRLERSEKERQIAEKEKQLAELQQQKTEVEMQALRAQMNPHFIFNSLNSINRFILKKQSSEATEYLTKFSRLIRMILNNSVSASVSIAEDLEALQLYLELESLRCEQKFSFKIKVDPDLDIDFIQVPPMLLQPFVENAIWHGLMNLPDRQAGLPTDQAGKEDRGHLSINILQENSTLICSITDDGIGRKKAAELKERSGKHKSMGMKITESRIAMMQKMNDENKSIEIRDLVGADGSATGTEVILKIPIGQV